MQVQSEVGYTTAHREVWFCMEVEECDTNRGIYRQIGLCGHWVSMCSKHFWVREKIRREVAWYKIFQMVVDCFNDNPRSFSGAPLSFLLNSKEGALHRLEGNHGGWKNYRNLSPIIKSWNKSKSEYMFCAKMGNSSFNKRHSVNHLQSRFKHFFKSVPRS